MSETVTTAEKAYTAGLLSEQEQDEAAERRYQLERSGVGKSLIDLLAYAEVVRTSAFMDKDEVSLAKRLLDVLGSVEDVWAINEVLA